ncbi:SRPBCC domain-containing protein [Gordonia kroppenstedtii]|uniref:SRPBCC domain-containing protein n=1 Tax=Jongsikchunia kroppenstedtii TaxID=1121721 RepID=UPI0009DA8362
MAVGTSKVCHPTESDTIPQTGPSITLVTCIFTFANFFRWFRHTPKVQAPDTPLLDTDTAPGIVAGVIVYREVRDISATPEQVYDVLTDLDGYDQWNPWVVRASGTVAAGSKVDVWPLLRGKEQHYRHRILEADRGRRFVWCDLGWFTLFAKGERHRTLEPSDGGCRYTVELRLNGIAKSTADKQFGQSMREGLAAEADALKTYCEQQ